MLKYELNQMYNGKLYFMGDSDKLEHLKNAAKSIKKDDIRNGALTTRYVIKDMQTGLLTAC